jgi:hypothetical protein
MLIDHRITFINSKKYYVLHQNFYRFHLQTENPSSYTYFTSDTLHEIKIYKTTLYIAFGGYIIWYGCKEQLSAAGRCIIYITIPHAQVLWHVLPITNRKLIGCIVSRQESGSCGGSSAILRALHRRLCLELELCMAAAPRGLSIEAVERALQWRQESRAAPPAEGDVAAAVVLALSALPTSEVERTCGCVQLAEWLGSDTSSGEVMQGYTEVN